MGKLSFRQLIDGMRREIAANPCWRWEGHKTVCIYDISDETMPVPVRTPVKTAAAKTIPETLRTLSAWAAMRAFCSAIFG